MVPSHDPPTRRRLLGNRSHEGSRAEAKATEEKSWIRDKSVFPQMGHNAAVLRYSGPVFGLEGARSGTRHLSRTFLFDR